MITRAARRCAERRSAQSGIKIKEKKFCLLVPVSLRPKGNWELEKSVPFRRSHVMYHSARLTCFVRRHSWSTGSLAWFDFRSEKELSLKDQILQANKEMNIIKKSRLHVSAARSPVQSCVLAERPTVHTKRISVSGRLTVSFRPSR